jgi:hypothetical protein
MIEEGEGRELSPGLYLVVMLGIIALFVGVIVPALFWRKCPSCRARNGLDASVCRKCGHELDEGQVGE